jgi:hypothetical protein
MPRRIALKQHQPRFSQALRDGNPRGDAVFEIQVTIMKSTLALLIICLFAAAPVNAQKHKNAPSRPRAASQPPAAGKPRMLGSTVIIVTKNGDRITGELLDLTAYSVRIKADNLESSIALDTIASLSFSAAASPDERDNHPLAPVRADFAREADLPMGLLQTLATSLKPGVDYTEYGRQLTELRRATERFLTKYSSTDSPAEARVISLLAGALTDYTWARSVWTLKFGRSSDGTISDTESPVVTDTLALYPDLRAPAAAGTKLSAEKLVAGLWRKASEKTDLARRLIATPR